MFIGKVKHAALSLARIAGLVAFSLAATGSAAHAQSEDRSIDVVLSVEPTDLDPGNTDYRTISHVTKLNVFEPLVFQDIRDSSINPRLATSWERIDDRTYRFTLREGVTFHDGTPFNADAVVFSVDRLFNENISAITRAQFFGENPVEAIRVDDYTVDIQAESTDPILLTRIAQIMMTSPNTPMDQIIRDPVGTGPYRLAAWEAGVEIVLERSEEYWGELPEVETATFVWRGEPTVAAQMVEVGEADITMSIPEELATSPEMDRAYPNYVTFYYIVGAWEPPLDDVRVREALNYSIDREALLGTLLPAQETLATALFPPATVGYNTDLEPYPYDPDRARALLEEARADGVDVDAEITMIGIQGHFPRSDEILEAVNAMLQDVGFNTSMRIVENALYRQYRDKPRIEGGPVLLQANHDNTTGDAGATVTRHLCSSNRNPICDEHLDSLILSGLEAEGDERREIWEEVARYMHEEVMVDLLMTHRVGFARVGPRIEFDVVGRNQANFFLEEISFAD
ncbi:MAG: ABC transporter substrate-binding protein [Azospirillaceae bacterium]